MGNVTYTMVTKLGQVSRFGWWTDLAPVGSGQIMATTIRIRILVTRYGLQKTHWKTKNGTPTFFSIWITECGEEIVEYFIAQCPALKETSATNIKILQNIYFIKKNLRTPVFTWEIWLPLLNGCFPPSAWSIVRSVITLSLIVWWVLNGGGVLLIRNQVKYSIFIHQTPVYIQHTCHCKPILS